jgi:hypothetical protein
MSAGSVSSPEWGVLRHQADSAQAGALGTRLLAALGHLNARARMARSISTAE